MSELDLPLRRAKISQKLVTCYQTNVCWPGPGPVAQRWICESQPAKKPFSISSQTDSSHCNSGHFQILPVHLYWKVEDNKPQMSSSLHCSSPVCRRSWPRRCSWCCWRSVWSTRTWPHWRRRCWWCSPSPSALWSWCSACWWGPPSSPPW